jgi:hypothetical protein
MHTVFSSCSSWFNRSYFILSSHYYIMFRSQEPSSGVYAVAHKLLHCWHTDHTLHINSLLLHKLIILIVLKIYKLKGCDVVPLLLLHICLLVVCAPSSILLFEELSLMPCLIYLLQWPWLSFLMYLYINSFISSNINLYSTLKLNHTRKQRHSQFSHMRHTKSNTRLTYLSFAHTNDEEHCAAHHTAEYNNSFES